MYLDFKKITILRARMELPVNQMLTKAGVPRGTWCAILRNKRTSPQTAGKLARALGCDVTEIIMEDADVKTDITE